MKQNRKADEQCLYSLPGNQQAEFFIRIKAWERFEALNQWNIKNCEEYHWNDKLAFCHILQGWYEVCRGRFDQAKEALTQAERILRPSGILEYICHLEWAWALLAEAEGDTPKGLQKLDESLFTCGDKGFRLWQADSLCLRGRLRLLQFRREGKKDKDLLEKAGDDADEALKIAGDTGYIWARIGALELLSSYHQERSALPDLHPEEEKDLAGQYAKEAESLKPGLFLSKGQMKALKAKARKAFEKQVAGWD